MHSLKHVLHKLNHVPACPAGRKGVMAPGRLLRERVNQLLRAVERFYGIQPLADHQDKMPLLALRCETLLAGWCKSRRVSYTETFH